MKKHLILTLAASLAAALPSQAVDLYITGSTAFRANVAAACAKLYDGGFNNEHDGTGATGGDSKAYPKAAQWVMSGTVSNTISALGTTPLTIHALFTGSVQGVQTVQQGTKLIFLAADGIHTVTNTPTIAFSDASSQVTPYPVDGSTFAEEAVAVQPFVFCKSVIGGVMNNVTNITAGQAQQMIKSGRIALSSFTGKASDHGTYIYTAERTKDSGTRLTFFKEEGYPYNQSASIYVLDLNPANTTTYNTWFKPNTNLVYGPVGNGNANLNWGSGYVGGGDIATALATNLPGNTAVGALSINDAKSIGTTANWAQVVPYNGVWPTAAGPGISGNTGTNDFTPITTGKYSFWGYEVVVYPAVDPSSVYTDQNLTAAQLGSATLPGTILGVLDAQSGGGTPLTGSIENEIELSKTGGATAIRLSDMVASRQAVGGTITP
jgi:hypothetical protein